MLACGQICRPRRIEIEFETYRSSTEPARVETDAGIGFIKGTGNRAGNCSLVSELLAAELGTWFGLQIPPFAIIDQCDLDIRTAVTGRRIEAPLFFSLNVDGAIPFDNSNLLLNSLSNKSDIVRLVIFDTWIRNTDRFLNGQTNSDNLLFAYNTETASYTMHPIDHSHCFTDGDFLDSYPDEACVVDDTLYGLFPSFAPYVLKAPVAAALSHLRTLDRAFVEACINQIPPQWGANVAAKRALADLICNRAAYVVSTIANKLLSSPELPGIGQ